MADRIKLRRGPKNNIDLNVYELGYVTDSDEERLYFNNGLMVPIPNDKDITDIKTELTETTNISNQNKQDVTELKESVAGIIRTGVAKLVQYSYDIELSENTKKVNIPYERYSSITDTLKVYVNGLAIQNDQYTVTDPVENDGIVTNGYIVLKVERPAGTIVRIEVWKNVPSGEEGEVSGNIITKNSLPIDRIKGINDIISNPNLLINGNFRNPVNQRNKLSYMSDNTYTIDRWMINGSSKIDVVNNGIKITPLSNGQTWDGIRQYIEDFKSLSNKKVTLSLKVNSIDGLWLAYIQLNSSENYEFLRINKTGIYSITIDIGEIKDKNKLSVVIDNNKSTFTPIEIEWVKLELGSLATPFAPRPYGEELDLCLRYYCRVRVAQNLITSDDGQIQVHLSTPKNMRIKPTAKYDSDVYFHNMSDGQAILIGHKGDSPHSLEEYANDCSISCWLENSNSATHISSGLCGTINGSDITGNRLTASAWILLDSEIY